jgi:hypothetical protein
MTRILLALLTASLLAVAPAHATHGQPPLDINQMKYEPIGHFKPGDPIPAAGTGCETDLLPLTKDGVFNPSGSWNSFDTNVFEVVCLPFRAPGDESAADPYGNGGEARHGYCKGSGSGTREGDWARVIGDCPNHQLEYIDYYEKTMGEILKDFGVTFQRYEFNAKAGSNTLGGRAINPAAIVPGADHPDESIVIGAHYDQTNDGQASAWDSAEGHSEIIRVAKLMADYWRATGTRPSATVKFVPWDAEEGGTLGSANYVADTIPPGQASKVRGYWNTDPCAGGYPSFRMGNPGDRIDMGIQLGLPADAKEGDPARITKFNEQAVNVLEQVLNRIDDTVPAAGGVPMETFIATEEATATRPSDVGLDIFIGQDRPVLFGSDWRNFIRAGIPFYNPGPEVTGPNSSDGTAGGIDPTKPGNPDALTIFHTPNDNIEFMQRYTGAANGMSESWMKGMEFCSHMLGWGMLQHDQGGAQTANTEVTAYFEALPNEAERNKPVAFDAGGSQQYSDPVARRLVSDADLDYEWDFGDGSPKAYGKTFNHAFRRDGTFKTRLTVTNVVTGQSASMTLPIVVEEAGNPAPPAENPGSPKPRRGGGGDPSGCAAAFPGASVAAKGSGLQIRFDGSAAVEILQASKGRRALAKPRRIARLDRSGSFTWDGLKARRPGVYEVRLKSGGKVRRFTVERRGKRFVVGQAPALAPGCGTIAAFGVTSPAFGGKVPLKASVRLTAPATAELLVYRGAAKKPVKRVRVSGRTASLTLAGAKARRGLYRVVLKLDGRATSTVFARRT